MKIQFLGAAEGVTGSCYYIDTGTSSFLVDCGQFQGSIQEQKKNVEPFPFDPKTLDFIILTHAHIDHSGRLPKLVQLGFSGPVYMTRGTASLSEILLLDSAKIQEYDNERENDQRRKAGLNLIEPYYTSEDVINTLQYFYPLLYEKTLNISDHITLRFINAGHLLGSAHVYLTIGSESYLFSGDIGTQHSQILKPPQPAPSADYVFMENTYGDRNHQDMDMRFQKLHDVIEETKGTIIIPAFSVGRTQDIIYGLKQLSAQQSLKHIPFYVDSPMAIHATKVFTKDTEGMQEALVNKIDQGEHPFHMQNLHFIDDANAAYMLNFNKDKKVLISASGMCDAGRILNHLTAFLGNPNTSIVFVGYQAEESLGHVIQSGKACVKIGKDEVANQARIVTLSGFSGHADQGELMTWLSRMDKPKKIFLCHGEKDSLATMEKLIHETYGFDTYIPKLYETIEI